MSGRLEGQQRFYHELFSQFGDDPRALSINSVDTQIRRYKTLSELFRYEVKNSFSVHEVGCGLGHYKTWLESERPGCDYSGSDICEPFITACSKKFPGVEFCLHDISSDLTGMPEAIQGKDYYLENGTFNPIEDVPVEEWERFVFTSVENMFAACKKGLAVNFLTTYSDRDKQSDRLYYADPLRLYDWVKKNLSRFVSILDDDPFYEFTLLIYQPKFIQSLHSGEYDRYFSA